MECARPRHSNVRPVVVIDFERARPLGKLLRPTTGALVTDSFNRTPFQFKACPEAFCACTIVRETLNVWQSMSFEFR